MLKIKYLFSVSKQLIAVAIIISFLVTLCLCGLVQAYKMVSTPSNGLSKGYFSFSIGEYRDKIVQGNIDLFQMLEFLKEQDRPILILKESDIGIWGVYAIKQGYEPDMISGRGFITSDFEEGSNTIIICDELQDDCLDRDGKKYFEFDANYYEVIGIYNRKGNSTNKDAKAYYNLSSRNLTGINPIYDNYIFGNYHVDAGRDTKEIVHLLDDYCTVDVTRSDIDNGFSRKLQKAIFEEGLTLFPIVLIIFLVLLNSISVATNWIENRKKEIYVRKLVGATNRQISLMLFVQFMFLITLSYLPAMLMGMVLSKINTQFIILEGLKNTMLTIVISYVTVTIIGFISGGFMLISYYKNSISQIKR
ncbi:MAG: ABC transporter permease [Clostridiaceae bacterium]|nr:ABC transporter permease [Clostridiaceae bacterium]